MKRLIVCLDGTWNNASREVEKGDSRVYRPTNVLKVARATRNFAKDGTLQITYYDAGVGAMNRAPDWRSKLIRKVDNTLGGGWGAGFEVNIEEAYTFLCNNFEPGDQVFIFGFSRGAAQARSLSQLIGWAGGFPPKRDAYYVPRIFSGYLAQRGFGNASEMISAINKWKDETGSERISIQPAKIRFLGLWDTVLALGSRLTSRHGSSGSAHSFHCSPIPPASVETLRHALAIDEKRHDFHAETLNGSQSLEQRWFAGAHSNVGGGLANDSLANLALTWIANEASAAGLEFDGDFMQHYRADAYGIVQPKAISYRFMDSALWPIRGYAGGRELRPGRDTLDPSVFVRLNALPATTKKLKASYRPDNLIQFLAEDSRYDGDLSDEVLAEVKRRRA